MKPGRIQPPAIIEDLAIPKLTDAEFLTEARSKAVAPHSVLLLSGGDHELSRYSILGWDPFLVFTSKGRTVTIQTPDGADTYETDPFEQFGRLIDEVKPDFPLIQPPFSGGALGYVGYEAKNLLERLPQTAVDDLGLPDMYFTFPRRLLIHDRRKGEGRRLVFGGTGVGTGSIPVDNGGFRPPSANDVRIGDLKSNFHKPDYLNAVTRIREYIRNGDVYQVNLSQRFSADAKIDPLNLFGRLFDLNPAPFYAYIDAGDHQVVSTSMERFLYGKGRFIETRPIKGTRRRGATPEEDEALRRELLESRKDDAELSMIVDLLRNDLGRVCSPGTIRVTQHRRMEKYQNVWHSVSVVAGELPQNTGVAEILRATFPGGSITGCPKIRSMEIIDELEPNVRHVYTGSIGYVGWHDNFDLNIAIRTLIHTQGRLHLAVGGGIVYDSDEEEEHQETLDKGRTFFQVLKTLAGEAQ